MQTNKIIKVIQEVHEQFKGGSGSGNFGHSGRPGKLGGSAGGGGMGGAVSQLFTNPPAGWNKRDSGGTQLLNKKFQAGDGTNYDITLTPVNSSASKVTMRVDYTTKRGKSASKSQQFVTPSAFSFVEDLQSGEQTMRGFGGMIGT